MSSAKRASELKRFFENAGSLIGASWQDVLMDNAQRVSGPLATRMLSQIGITQETTMPFRLFDNACGAGAVAQEVHRLVKPEVLQKSSILCGDFSDPSVELSRKRAEEEGWVNTNAEKIDAQKTGLPSGEFSHVTTNIGFHVVPDSKAALDEAIRILKPGGTLGFTTWAQMPGWAEDLQSAFASFPFEAPFSFGVQTTEWGNWGDVDWIRKELEERGLEDVKVELFAFTSHVDNVEHYIATAGMMIDWVVSSNWSEEVRKEHGRDEYQRLVKDFLEHKYDGKGWDQKWVAVVASGRVLARR
ncbi:S-adenosyl-L-methionine-dependent methyltransferase [Apodospora peruviana]|uniref:S-adenosyl-L-methionine-dependent methyltransferase n=1 Tax=Apodospora peruviana TaxID=516989 RepID=A0AAE0I582_9PEZI|nr:S-adenosyl-L-methionine-dependent methyltransferase [Apodospora peruviana]KAK3318853.1 S-adenosyl-L-methionine-dependent methyltransferase [Apodospora peruviana]